MSVSLDRCRAAPIAVMERVRRTITMLSRRQFNRILLAGFACAGVGAPSAVRAASRLAIGSGHRDWLLAVLPEVDRRFDPFAKMLVASASDVSGDNGDSRAGSVHSTRASLNYAAALLDTGDMERVERANEILRVVIGLQDRDRGSKTFGCWPRHLEEPLENVALPDSVQAAVCAMPLLMAWMFNREQVVADLRQPHREAILDAAESVRRRNLPPASMDVAIRDIGLTLLVAQEFKLPALRVFAKEHLRKLHALSTRRELFVEYNSPHLFGEVLQELARLIWLVKDGRDVALLRELHDLSWKHVATRFHAPTRQWSGPHSRAEETDLRKLPSTLALLQQATGKPGSLGLAEPLPLSLENYRVPVACPRKLIRSFTHLDESRQAVEVFTRADPAKVGAHQAVIGTTWLHPRFCLGTVNRGELSMRRRPFLAYWGNAGAPRFLRLRLLKDGADFASALFFCAQHEGSALSVVTFCTDQGGSGSTVDSPKDGIVVVKDLRLRLEFGGDLAGCTVRTEVALDASRCIVIQDRDVRFVVRPVSGRFDLNAPRWDFPELSLAKHFDAILHTGESKQIDLRRINEAFVCFAFEEWTYGQREVPVSKLETQLNAGQFRARWVTNAKTLDVSVPIRPASRASMNDGFRSSVG